MDRFYRRRLIPMAFPAMLLFLLVILIPFIVGVCYSFSAWRGTYFVDGEHFWDAFVGLDNYIRAFRSEKFISSFIYTCKFTLIAVIVINVVSLLMALMTTSIDKAGKVYRTIFFLPNLLGGLALGYIWSFIFEIVFSKILFGTKGIVSIPILCNMTQNSTKALFALTMLVTWQLAGYMMLIYTVGLQNIPKDLLEAAQIDGACTWQCFWRITVPMLMPAFTIVFFLTLANCFKLLDQNIALTDGNFGTRMLATQILRTTRDTNPPDYGLAQAQAVIFFILIALVTLLQVSFTKKKEVEL